MLKKVERTFYQEPRFPERRRLSSNMGAGK